MKLLLDTNAYSDLMRGREAVSQLVRRSEQLYLSVVVAGELMHGFRLGNRFEANRRALESFIARPFVSLLPVSLDTADRFGRIASSLRRQGTPIPTNDIWIAAHAMESGAELLSSDHHFERVPGLAWICPESVGDAAVPTRAG